MADEKNEVKIKISGDSKGAEGAISRASGALKGLLRPLTMVRGAISAVMRAMGVFYLAAEGVRLVTDGIKKLQEWMNRAATAAKELQEALRADSIATSAALSAKAYKDLNKALAEANRLEKERNDIIDRRRAAGRDVEDADLELSRERELAALDPASATYEEDKAAIGRKYARRASALAADRASEDAKLERGRLEAEAATKDRQALEVEKVYARQMRAADRQEGVVREYGYAARRGEDGAKEKYDKAEAEWKVMYDAAKATGEAAEAMRKEAESLRRRAAALDPDAQGASMRNSAAQMRIDREEREAKAKADQGAKAEAEREAQAKDREEESKRKEEARAAAQAMREVDSRARAMAGGMAGADAVSSNRLTAMGLGSGVSAKGGVADNVKRIVDLLKEEVAATKGIKAEGSFGPAIYSE